MSSQHALGQWLASKSFKTSGKGSKKKKAGGGGGKRKAGRQNVWRKIGCRLVTGISLKAFWLALLFFFFFLKHQKTSHPCVAEVSSVVIISYKGYDLFSTTCSMYTGTIPKIASQSRSNIVVICSLY